MNISSAGTFRLGGRGLSPTNPFTSPRTSGTVLVDGKMGTIARHGVGTGLLIGGVVEALAGVYLIDTAGDRMGDYSSSLSNKDFYTYVGVGGLVRAALLLGIGTWLLATGFSSAEVR